MRKNNASFGKRDLASNKDSDESMTPSELEAMNFADEDKIFILKEQAKSTLTFNMNPDRFNCVLSQTAGKQRDTKRLYL